MSTDELSVPRPPADLNPRREPVLDFPDGAFGTLTPADYDHLGFMAGLEVHQQLLTRRKLFCRCPAARRVHQVDAEVLRHMRPTLSELGEYDGCALMEFKTRKEIVYLLERGTVCTYEIDDTPPFEVDEEAVRIAVELSRVLDMNLVSELHVMRKQYLDGSIPTGFQRTAMVGLGGEIPFRASELGPGRVLRIRQLSLEEDSCREVSDIGHRVTFRTDRLGTPLSETVTEPDLLTPHDVEAGARLVAQTARATGKVRRGAGAARQDVNVSIAGGRRVELKGVSQHRGLPRLVHVEAFRQLSLLRLKAELERRGLHPELLSMPVETMPWERSPLVLDARATVRRCIFAPLRDALDRKEMVCAVKLPGFGGLLSHRTQPGVTFARELSDRVRVIACLTGRPFMIHSGVADYGLGGTTWRQLRTALKAGDEDALVVVWGPAPDAATGVREVLARCREAFEGVPAETRQSFPDGTTGFERILPGPDRMYPDTDTPPLPIPDRWVQEIDARLPERPWDREARYVARGLSVGQARRVSYAPWSQLFEQVRTVSASTRRRLASTLDKRLVHLWRAQGAQTLPDAERIQPLVDAVDAGRLDVGAFEVVFDRLVRENDRLAADIIADYTLAPDSPDREALIRAAITGVMAARPTIRSRCPDAILRWAMGQSMPDLIGKIDPSRVRARLIAALELEPNTGTIGVNP